MKHQRSLILGLTLIVFLAVALWAQVGVKGGKVRGFDPVNSIRILNQKTQTLQAQLKDLQARINAAKTASPRLAAANIRGKVTWFEPVNGMRNTLASMRPEANKVQSYFRRARIAQGVKLSGELQTNLSSLGAALDKLATTSNVPQAQVSANGINRSVGSLWKVIFALRSLHPAGYQGITKDEAEANHQSICDGQEANHPPGTQCVADCTLTTTGTDPGPEDDEFTCTCKC